MKISYKSVPFEADLSRVDFNEADVWLGENLAEFRVSEIDGQDMFTMDVYDNQSNLRGGFYEFAEEENPVGMLLERWLQMLVKEHLEFHFRAF